jgi:hypothetical protein
MERSVALGGCNSTFAGNRLVAQSHRIAPRQQRQHWRLSVSAAAASQEPQPPKSKKISGSLEEVRIVYVGDGPAGGGVWAAGAQRAPALCLHQLCVTSATGPTASPLLRVATRGFS